MLPPELQPRPYIAPSINFPTTFNNGYSPERNSSPNGISSNRRSLENSRFAPSAFVYNARIAIALVPCAAFLLDLGGTPVVAALTLGLMIAYILDSLNFKSGAFCAVWFSLISAQITFFFSSSLFISFNSIILGLLACFVCALSNFLIGVWASLQFKWIQMEYPTVVLALETLLFACTPYTASVLLSWATVSAVGMANVSYYYMTFNCIFYWLYSLPRVSSFKLKQQVSYLGGEVPDDILILGKFESSSHTITLICFPLMFYNTSRCSLELSLTPTICDMFLSFFIPVLFLLYASTRGALWWHTKCEHELRRIRVVSGAVALVIVVIGLEFRLVFHSYIQVPWPWDYLLVTVTMLGGAGAYAMGMIAGASSSLAFTGLAVFVSAAGAIVVGFPVLFIPLPALAGFYLARFVTKKSISAYSAFVILGSLMVTWFVHHYFWDLDIWLAGMSLQSFCKLIVADVILAMVVPGLSLLPQKLRYLTGMGLIGHALLLSYIENRLYTYSEVYYTDDEVMYPSYMVVLTTFVGLGLVRRLFVVQRIGPKAVWVLTCLYTSKLAMLFITSKAAIWASTILLSAVSPPVLLYKDRSRTGSKMKPWQGYSHGAVFGLSVWFCRDTIFEALEWWNGRSPSGSLLLGCCILVTGLACVPIVALHFSRVMSAKRSLVIIVATGLLFIIMQPPLPSSWNYHSELTTDDITIYGFITSKPRWPSWLLISSIVVSLAAITSIIPIKNRVELRTIFSIAMGFALGVYISAEYFLHATVSHILIVFTMVCASVFVVFTHLPSASSTKILPWVFALLVALFPVTYLLEGQVRVKNLLAEEEEDSMLTTLLAVQGARRSLLGLYAAIFMLIALEIKFELREKVNKRGGLRPCRNMQQRWVSTFTIKKLAAEGAWMPAVGNVATLLCFAICLMLNVNLTGIFFISPVLLLLNQDSDFVAGFGDKQRYFPITVVISGYLVLTSLFSIWEEIWQGNDWFFAVTNLGLLILPIPSHIMFNQFVWSHKKRNDLMPLLAIPLNLAPSIIADVMKIRILGLLGIMYSLAQYLISRKQYTSGLMYI